MSFSVLCRVLHMNMIEAHSKNFTLSNAPCLHDIICFIYLVNVPLPKTASFVASKIANIKN